MSTEAKPSEILDAEFLPIRAKLLEVAAALDRIDRAGSVAGDQRMGQIAQAIELLESSDPDRAERMQLVFSLDYDAKWRERFAV